MSMGLGVLAFLFFKEGILLLKKIPGWSFSGDRGGNK